MLLIYIVAVVALLALLGLGMNWLDKAAARGFLFHRPRWWK